jgi:hypothetical protein
LCLGCHSSIEPLSCVRIGSLLLGASQGPCFAMGNSISIYLILYVADIYIQMVWQAFHSSGDGDYEKNSSFWELQALGKETSENIVGSLGESIGKIIIGTLIYLFTLSFKIPCWLSNIFHLENAAQINMLRKCWLYDMVDHTITFTIIVITILGGKFLFNQPN